MNHPLLSYGSEAELPNRIPKGKGLLKSEAVKEIKHLNTVEGVLEIYRLSTSPEAKRLAIEKVIRILERNGYKPKMLPAEYLKSIGAKRRIGYTQSFISGINSPFFFEALSFVNICVLTSPDGGKNYEVYYKIIA